MGILNQMSKFYPNIAHLSKHLRGLLSSRTVWTWSVVQYDAFLKLKEKICSPRVLALYDVEATTKVSTDASAYRLRAVLLQLKKGLWQSVVFAFHALSQTEACYAPKRERSTGTDKGF